MKSKQYKKKLEDIEILNDFCPFIYEDCGMPKDEKIYYWGCFGHYKQCEYYKKLKGGLNKNEYKRYEDK